MTKIDELRKKIELKRQLIDLTREEIKWLSHDLGAALRKEGLEGEHLEVKAGADMETYTTKG